MSGLGETRALRAAENAVIPDARILTGEEYRAPATKSDRQPECLLREGHRVHFVAVAHSQHEDPVVRELHCASHHCDYHAPPVDVNDTVSVNTEREDVARDDYEDYTHVYVGEAVLTADYDDPDDPGLGLIDIEIEAYTEELSVPAPADD